MDQNNKQNRGIVGYLILLVMLLGIFLISNFFTMNKPGYTIYNMEKALESGLVAVARITPDQVPPTGVVELTLTSGETMNIQVTDVAQAEEMLKEYKIYPVINKAQGEGILTSVILPLGLSILAVMIVISLMNRGGGGQGRLENFGKRPARLSKGKEGVTY